MELTGKCREDFEKWLVDNDIFKDYQTPDFYEYIPSMKWGVYVDFFIYKDIYIETPFYWGANWWRYEISIRDKNNKSNTILIKEKESFNSHKEARKAAINKANELYNNA